MIGTVIGYEGPEPGPKLNSVRVEEVLHGLPHGTKEILVDTSPNTSCGFTPERDKKLLFYASEPKTVGRRQLAAAIFCSHTGAVEGRELLIQGLREMERGRGSRLIGSIQLSGRFHFEDSSNLSGIRIAAVTGDKRFETASFGNGEFEFTNLPDGAYTLSVVSPGFTTDPSKFPKADPKVSAKINGYQLLLVWRDGRISGLVRGPDGKPLADVPVQAFVQDLMGRPDSMPFQQAKSRADGTYELSGLPSGPVWVAVNGAKYTDEGVWPPQFYPAAPNRAAATPLQLGPGEQRSGIDLRLGPARTPAVLDVETVDDTGAPIRDARCSLSDLDGTARYFKIADRGASTVRLLPFVGNAYTVRCFRVTLPKEWEGSAPVTIREREMKIRVPMTAKTMGQ